MCFGTTTTCTGCKRPTIYLLAGIRRCPNRGLPTHTITGPKTSTSTCWQCRENISLDEKAHHYAWQEQARLLFGYHELLKEAECEIRDLASEIAEERDETKVRQLEELKKVEEEKARSYAMAVSGLDKWREEPTAPITVIIPPSHEDPTPMIFGEWVNDFGIEELRGESNEDYENHFNLNDYSYKAYLEDNSYEHQLDRYRAQVDSLRYTERKEFDFKPEGEKELLSFRGWMRRERLGVLREVEERPNAYPGKGRTHERFEHALELYGKYLKASTPEGSTVLGEFRAHIAEGHRRQVTELTHKVNGNDPTEATELKSLTRANTREPMSFDEWSNSPLAWRSSHLAKNSNASLRADLRDYTASSTLSQGPRS